MLWRTEGQTSYTQKLYRKHGIRNGAFTLDAPTNAAHYLLAYKATPGHVTGAIRNDLLPAEAPDEVAPAATMDLNFSTNVYVGAATPSDVLETDISASRNAKNAAGVDTAFAAGVLARTDLGIFRSGGIAPNLFPNPSLSGAAVGLPGTLPTGFAAANSAEVSADVVGVGANYIDVHIYGTFTANASVTLINTVTLPVSQGKSYTIKTSTQLVAGSIANLGWRRMMATIRDSGDQRLDDPQILETLSTTGSLVENVNTHVAVSQATAAKMEIYYQFIGTGAVSMTIRIASPSVVDNAVSGVAENITAKGELLAALQTTAGSVMIEIGSITLHGANSALSGNILSAQSGDALEIIKQHGPTQMKTRGMSNPAYVGASGILGVSRVMVTWNNTAGKMKICYNGGKVTTVNAKLNDASGSATQVDTLRLLAGVEGFIRRIKTWTRAESEAIMIAQTALTGFDHNVSDAVKLFGRSVTFDSDFDNGLSMLTRATSPAGYGEGTAPVYNNDGKFSPRQLNGKEYALGFCNHDGNEYQFGLDPTHPDLIAIGYSPFSVSNGICTTSGLRVNGSTIPSGLNTIMNNVAKVPDRDAPTGGRHPYSSGALTTQGTFKQAFGYWETCASADAYYPGRWSAFWMGGDRAQTLAKNAVILAAQGEDPAAAGTWPPEIDVMECQTAEAFGNAWWGPVWWQAEQISWLNNKSIADASGNDWTDYNTYSCLWDAAGLSYYLNGRRYMYFAKPVAGQPKWPTATGRNVWSSTEAGRWPYDGDIEMYILMTHTIGSDNTSLDGTIAGIQSDPPGTGQLIDKNGTTPDTVQVRWRHTKVWSA
ncbi:MAG: family 16 glycosylhydrolase [Beijerinckiaceae bacterium]|nr:family 16 glycosylhydrolase [Beijerinckiaceae bacterium]